MQECSRTRGPKKGEAMEGFEGWDQELVLDLEADRKPMEECKEEHSMIRW